MSQNEVTMQGVVMDDDTSDTSSSPQDLKDFLFTCHTLNQATMLFSNTPSQMPDTPSAEDQEKEHAQRILKSPDFIENQAAVWLMLLKDETSSFQKTIFPSASVVHDQFFMVGIVDGSQRLCAFDRLGVSTTVLTLVRYVLQDPALRKAAGIGGEIRYNSAGSSNQQVIPAEPQFRDDAFENGRFRGFSLYSNLNGDRPLSFVVIEYRPQDFALDSSMIEALENGIVSTGGNSDDASSPAAVITALISRLLSHMAKSAVRYGYLYSVEGIVFLEVQRDPSVVHYFVSLPKDEVDTTVDSTMHYSAVSQIFAFVVRAMRTRTESTQCSETEEIAPWTMSTDERATLQRKAHEDALELRKEAMEEAAWFARENEEAAAFYNKSNADAAAWHEKANEGAALYMDADADSDDAA